VHLVPLLGKPLVIILLIASFVSTINGPTVSAFIDDAKQEQITRGPFVSRPQTHSRRACSPIVSDVPLPSRC
jgi:hypothetical protein